MFLRFAELVGGSGTLLRGDVTLLLGKKVAEGSAVIH